MKILIDARLYGLENAGLGRYLINLVGELVKLDTKNEYVLLLRKKYFENLSLPRNWKKVLADFRHYGIAEQLLIPGIISKEKPDLVHFPHFNAPIFYRGKYIVTVHDMLMHDFAGLSATTLPTPFYYLKRIIYKLVFKRAVTGSLRIIVPSEVVKNELVDYYKLKSGKIDVVYEGFDENIGEKYQAKVEKPYLVYTGNAYPHKNLDRLIEAVVSLNKSAGNKVFLAIASSRSVFTERLQKLIEGSGAQSYVKLLGFVPDAKLGSLYKNSVGFVFPSLSEGFGLPGLEAMNCGTLVLASEIPVFKEIYGGNALYFNPLDFSSIQKAMKDALEMDKEAREERINNAKVFVKRYSWVKMTKQTLDIYKGVFVPR
jgi:glycosyltransferase involved in cell wall biosynthesis